MTKGTKSWWATHVSAGVVAAVALIFGVTQCSGKQELAQEKANKQWENTAQADSLRMFKDSVNVLNARLVETTRKLNKCEKGKRCVRKKTTKPVAKPVAKPVVKPVEQQGNNKVQVKGDDNVVVIGNNNVVNTVAAEKADTVREIHVRCVYHRRVRQYKYR